MRLVLLRLEHSATCTLFPYTTLFRSHRERCLGISLQVLVLHPSPGGVEADVRAVVVHPDRGHLWGAIPAHGRDMSERLFREQITVVLWNRRHGHFPLLLSSSSTEKAWRTDL